MEESDIFQSLKRTGYQPLKVVGDNFELEHNSSGCVFLGQDQLCGLHDEGGPRSKPSPCRLFPFQVVSTPDGYYCNLSFSCPAVIFGTGEPVSQHSEELQQTMADAPHFFPSGAVPSQGVQLTEKRTLPWEEYLLLEKRLLQILDSNRDPSRALSRMVATILSPIGDNAILAAGIGQTLKTVSKLVLAILERPQDLEERMQVIAALNEQSSFHSQLLDQPLPGFSARRQDQLSDQLLIRFVAGQIEGKRLITGPNFLMRMLYLLILVDIFRFYLEAHYGLLGERHFSTTAVEWCFDLIETQALHHFDLVEPVLVQWSRDIVDASQNMGEC